MKRLGKERRRKKMIIVHITHSYHRCNGKIGEVYRGFYVEKERMS